MNRPRDIVNSDHKSQELVRYLNTLYDFMDVKAYYVELGGTEQAVIDAVEAMEETVTSQHTYFLKAEMPALLRDPLFQPYTERLLNEYKKMGLVSEEEAKVFEGELQLQRYAQEVVSLKKNKKVRGIAGMNKLPSGLDKQRIAALFDYYAAADNDVVDTLLLFKMAGGATDLSATEQQSSVLLQRRHELQNELLRIKRDMKDDQQTQFLVDKFGKDLNLNLDLLNLDKPQAKNSLPNATKDAKSKDKPDTSKTDKEKKDDVGVKKSTLAERRAKRLEEKKEKAAAEKKVVSKSKDKKDKDEKEDKKKTDKDKKEDKKKVDKKKDDKKDDKKKDDKKKEDKKKDDKKKDDKKKSSTSKDKKKK